MIYFVLCPSYHGATLLSLLMNNHRDVLCLGDTNPTRAFDQTCSCGALVSECEFWRRIDGISARFGEDSLPNYLPQYPYLTPWKPVNRGLNTGLALAATRFGRGAWRLGGGSAQRFRDIYGDFLEVCQTWSPHHAFVDGEKSLVKLMAVASMGFPVNGVIHLTRDPRGFLYSARKYLPDWTADEAVQAWVVQHRRIRRYLDVFGAMPVMTLRYEDVAENPREAMSRLFAFMGLNRDEVVCPPKDPRKHHLIGNRMLQSFTGTVAADTAWRTNLSAEDQDRTWRQAGELAAMFGYRA